MAITLTDILTEYGAYYEKSGQNQKRVKKLILQDTVTTGFMTQMKTDETLFKLASAVLTDLVQPFQKDFTAKGTATFKPNKIELHKMKVDISLYPDDIEASWLGFLASSDLSRKDWPLVKFLVEGWILPKIRENMELQAIYKGVRAEPEEGVAGATAAAMDGLKKKLQVGVAAGTINQVTGIGALDTATIFDQVEAFHDAISQVYQGVPMNIFLSPAWVKAYLRDKRSNGFYQISGPNMIDNSVDFTPHKVVALPSMSGTDDIFASPKENLIHLTKKDINQSRFDIQVADRQVKLLTDWWEGVGFGINEAVWTTVGAASGSN